MIEIAIAAIIAFLSGSGITLPIASRNAINRLRQQLLKEAKDKAGLLAQEEATAMAQAEANKLMLVEKQAEVNAQQILLLQEQNRRDELDLETKRLETARLEAENLGCQERIETEKTRQLELEASMADERLRMAEIEAEREHREEELRKEGAILAEEERRREEERLKEEKAKVEEQQKLAEQREHELALEREKTEVARLELEIAMVGEREQERLEQHRRNCRRIAEDIKRSIPFRAVEALLEGNTLGLHVDGCLHGEKDCWLPDTGWVLQAMAELSVCLDLPFSKTESWKLVSRKPTLRELVATSIGQSDNLGKSIVLTDLSILVAANKHSDYLRWEMALVSGKAILLEASAVAPIPTCEEELVVIFGGLFQDMFSLLDHPRAKEED